MTLRLVQEMWIQVNSDQARGPLLPAVKGLGRFSLHAREREGRRAKSLGSTVPLFSARLLGLRAATYIHELLFSCGVQSHGFCASCFFLCFCPAVRWIAPTRPRFRRPTPSFNPVYRTMFFPGIRACFARGSSSLVHSCVVWLLLTCVLAFVRLRRSGCTSSAGGRGWRRGLSTPSARRWCTGYRFAAIRWEG